MRIVRTQNAFRSSSIPKFPRSDLSLDTFKPRRETMLKGITKELLGVGTSLGAKTRCYGVAAALAAGTFALGKSTGFVGSMAGLAGLAGGATLGGLSAIALADSGKVPVQLVPVATAGAIAVGAVAAGISTAVLSGMAGGPLVGAGLALLSVPGGLVAGKMLNKVLS